MVNFKRPTTSYFDADHPFWRVFRSAWFSGIDAVAHEVDMDCIDTADFEQVTVANWRASGFRAQRWAFAKEQATGCVAGRTSRWRWQDGLRWRTICSTGTVICSMVSHLTSLPKLTNAKAMTRSRAGSFARVLSRLWKRWKESFLTCAVGRCR